jgi:hypothetical protein
MAHRIECELTDAGESTEGESFHVHLTWKPAHDLTLEQRAQRYKQLRRKLDRFHNNLGEHEEHD